jgi:hypothetical protein
MIGPRPNADPLADFVIVVARRMGQQGFAGFQVQRLRRTHAA